MTLGQLTLGIVILTLGVAAALYHRSPLPVAHSVGDPVVEAIRWALLAPTALLLLGELLAPQRLAWAHFHAHDAVRYAAAVVALAVTALIVWSFAAMGRHFATTLAIREQHELVTRGPYRFVRHPMYVLGFALLLALGLTTANWPALALGPAAMALLMLARVPKEERLLATHFGDRWHAYTRTTGRFLPRFKRQDDAHA